jgi:hypothetical protein
MKEQQKHLDAFETYFTSRQGGAKISDSVRLVSSEHKVTTKTVWKWKAEFDWDSREAVRAAEINKKIQEKTDSSIIKNKSNYLSLIHNAFAEYTKGIKDGTREPIAINNMNDLATGIRTALLVLDQPTDNIKTTGSGELKVKTEVYIPNDPNLRRMGRDLIRSIRTSKMESSDSSDGNK